MDYSKYPQSSPHPLKKVSPKPQASNKLPALKVSDSDSSVLQKKRNSILSMLETNSKSESILKITSQKYFNSTPRQEKNYDFEGLKDIVPKWMLDRNDFKEFYVKSSQIENMDLEKVVNIPNEARDQIEKGLIFNWINSKEYFRSMPKSINREICSRLICRVAKKNETGDFYVVIAEGTKADFLYIIYKGVVGVYVNRLKVATNKEGDVFGDVAIHNNSTRKADVIAESDQVVMFLISDVDYRSILFNYKLYEKKKFCKFISTISFFSHWNLNKIQNFSETLMKVEFKAGDVIYEYSEESQVFFIIKSGKVEIQTIINLEQSNRWPIDCYEWNIRKVMTKYIYPLKVLDKCHYFGQFELIRNTPRETRAVAIEDSVCLSLNKADFENFIRDKDLRILQTQNESYIPSKYEMEKTARTNITEVKKNKQILMEAMQINYLPVDKDCLNDNRSKKLKKWVKSVETRKIDEETNINKRIVSKFSMKKEAFDTSRRCTKVLHNIGEDARIEQNKSRTTLTSPVPIYNTLEKLKRATLSPNNINERGFKLPLSPLSSSVRNSILFSNTNNKKYYK